MGPITSIISITRIVIEQRDHLRIYRNISITHDLQYNDNIVDHRMDIPEDILKAFQRDIPMEDITWIPTEDLIDHMIITQLNLWSQDHVEELFPTIC